MAKYLLIESRDPFGSNDVGRYYELAEQLKAAGNEVTLFLLENGVMPARRSTQSARLTQLAKSGVEVLADAFSLNERGIAQSGLAEGVKQAPLEVLVDQLEQGRKAIWH